MRVLRGRGEDRAADRALTADLLDHTSGTGEPGLRVWRPHRQVAFGRRDAGADGYDRAREIAADRGFPPVERRVGGRAVAYTGSTVSVALTAPVTDERRGIADRYDEASIAIQRALWRLGVPAQRGEPPDAFCPGTHSLQWRGKIAGIAQRVAGEAALVGAVVIVDGHDELAGVLGPVYGALSVPLDPESIGSIERAGGDPTPDRVERTIEGLLVRDRDHRVEEVTAA